jgi:hypothetical protein
LTDCSVAAYSVLFLPPKLQSKLGYIKDLAVSALTLFNTFSTHIYFILYISILLFFFFKLKKNPCLGNRLPHLTDCFSSSTLLFPTFFGHDKKLTVAGEERRRRRSRRSRQFFTSGNADHSDNASMNGEEGQQRGKKWASAPPPPLSPRPTTHYFGHGREGGGGGEK